MKRCPTCSRTFEDTLTYCLIDGSVLSAPFADSSENARGGPTEILPSNERRENAPPETSPASTITAMYQPAGEPRLEPRGTIAAPQKKPYVLVAIIALAALFFLISISVFVILNRASYSYNSFLFLRRAPIFLIVAIGIVLSLVRMRRHPRASLLTMLAMVLLAFVGIFFTLLLQWLTRDMSAAGANRFYDVARVFQDFIFAAEIVLLVAAAYSDRRPIGQLRSEGT